MKKPVQNIFQQGVSFFREIFDKKYMIYELSKDDFNKQYLGSFLGIFWAFFDPLAFMAILWFVFSVGLRVGRTENVPFVAYLFTGLIAYNFFQNAVGASPGIIRSYAFVVNKVNFRSSILPIVKAISALAVHLVFVIIVMGVLVASHVPPSRFWFQIIYYLFAMVFLILGFSWLLSALGVFVKDIGNVVSIILRFGFWLTPIFWPISMIPDKYLIFLKLNPVFYLVQGYRESFIYGVWFWEHPLYTLYFWIFSFVIFVLGVFVFRRLRPHFADVL